MNLPNQKSPEHYLGVRVASDWIRDLESSDSRLHKERVIEKALVAARLGSASAECFLYNCYLTYNPFFVYGVKQVPETTGLVYRDNDWSVFWQLCEKLRTNQISGHRARDQIVRVSEQFDSNEWNSVCRRVLIKDLRCGISVKTLNKVLSNSEWKIPTFEVQLAVDSKNRPNSLRGSVRLEPKLDGVRTIAIVHHDSVVLYSRNGKEFKNFEHIAQQLREIVAKHGRKQSLVFDGEIVGNSFQNLMRQAQRKTDVDTADCDYYIFDLMYLDEFQRGFSNTQQSKRLEHLNEFRALINGCENLCALSGLYLNFDDADVANLMQDYAEQCVNQGYEGIMIKQLDAPYECRRNDSWMKWKPVITVDLTVVDVESGTGRNQARLGALICEGEDDGRAIRVNVGSGLSDNDRDSFWRHRDSLLGRVAEIAADAVTQNQDGTYSLRFPRFVRFRGFDPGEKI